jgi:hypothetical protein
MQKLIYETMFNKLVKIGLITPDGKLTFKDYVKIENKPYMDLSVDRLYNQDPKTILISIAHNFIQNSDVMSDPEMVIKIHTELKMIESLSYTLSSLGVYQVVYPEPGKVYPKRKKDLNHFLNQWLSNLIDQGFKYKKINPIIEVN